MRAAAEQAGVNHRAAYRHFADKRALLAALATDGWRRCTAAGQRTMKRATATPRAQLDAFVAGFARQALALPAHLEVMTGPRLNVDGAHPDLEGAIADAMALVAAPLVALGHAAGTRATVAGLAVWAALLGALALVRHQRVRVRPAGRAALVATLVAPTLDGLTRR